jgi:hypothetical protein
VIKQQRGPYESGFPFYHYAMMHKRTGRLAHVFRIQTGLYSLWSIQVRDSGKHHDFTWKPGFSARWESLGEL